MAKSYLKDTKWSNHHPNHPKRQQLPPWSIQQQVNRDVGSSVILHWRPDQVAGTVIPILHQEKQAEIQPKVLESFSIRKRAKDLLEYAKRAVEIAIEQGEQAAIDALVSVVGAPVK